MRDEFDALKLDLAAVRTSASRLADAAANAAKAVPSDADCGPRIVEEMNELATGMQAIKNQFSLMQDEVGVQAADFARKVRVFELELRKGDNKWPIHMLQRYTSLRLRASHGTTPKWAYWGVLAGAK